MAVDQEDATTFSLIENEEDLSHALGRALQVIEHMKRIGYGYASGTAAVRFDDELRDELYVLRGRLNTAMGQAKALIKAIDSSVEDNT